MLSPRREHDFNKIDVFEKYPKIFDFGLIFGGQNGEKSRKTCVEKHVFFEHRILCVFLRILTISARFWEAPGSPQIAKIFQKILEKLQNISKNRFQAAFRARLGFGRDFRSDVEAILGRFGVDSGSFLKGF